MPLMLGDLNTTYTSYWQHKPTYFRNKYISGNLVLLCEHMQVKNHTTHRMCLLVMVFG